MLAVVVLVAAPLTPLGSHIIEPARAVVPSAPTGLGAESGVKPVGNALTWTVGLTWTPVTASPSVSSFKIFRGTSPGIVSLLDEVSSGPGTCTSTPPPGTCSYVDTNNVLNGNTYYYRVSAVNADGVGTQSGELAVPVGGIKFKNYPSTVAQSGSNEMSVGSNWLTGRAWLADRFNPTRTQFNDALFPASATFTAISGLGNEPQIVGLDPLLWTDSQLGRTWNGEEEGYCAQTYFTDNDGVSWTPSINMCGGVDHLTFATGPYSSTPLAPPSPPAYPHGMYYCSQDIALAECSFSVDGGLTFGPSRPIYTLLNCGGLHGQVRVAPDGTSYVPNKNCSPGQGFAHSTNNGNTWSVRVVPNSGGASRFDPGIAIGSENRIYFGYSQGGQRPRAAAMDSPTGAIVFDRPLDTPAGVTLARTEFMTAVAGDNDRAAVAFLGTTTNPSGGCDANDPAVWRLYVSMTYDGGNTWTTTDLTGVDPVQVGRLGAPGDVCRNLLDFMGITVDKLGRVLVGWQDGCTRRTGTAGSGATGPCLDANGNVFSGTTSGNSRDSWATISMQTSGLGLFSAFDPPSLPGVPTGLVATPGDSSVALAWAAPASNGGSPVTGYRVYRGPSAGSLSLLATTSSVPGYLDATVTNGVTYFYAVSAVNALGEGPRSGTVSVVPMPVSLPGAPLGLVAAAGNQRATLSWGSPLSDGGAAIMNYRLHRSISPAPPAALGNVGNLLAFTDTGLTNGVTYCFAVSAINSVGEGPLSGTACATPATVAIDWPQFQRDQANTGSTPATGLLSAPLPAPLTATLAGPATSGPVIANLDTDPELEIVAVSDFGLDGNVHVQAFEVDGSTLVQKWTTGTTLAMPPATFAANDGRLNTPWVGDLDQSGDGFIEVLVSGAYRANAQGASNNRLIMAVLDGATGALLSYIGDQTTDPGATSLLAPPAVGDVDGDPALEIVTGGISNTGEALGWEFTRPAGLVPKWTYDQAQNLDMDMKAALAELDSGHAGLEVLLGTLGGNTANGRVVVLKPTDVGPGPSPATGDTANSNPVGTGVRGLAVGQLDAAAGLEIVTHGQFGSGTQPNTLAVLHCGPAAAPTPTSCTSVSRVANINGGYLWNTPSLSNLDLDAALEIVSANTNNFIDDDSGQFLGGTTHDGSLRASDFTGAALPALAALARPGSSTDDREVEGGVAVADIDGDGNRELLFGSNDGSLYAYRAVGGAFAPVWSFAAGQPIRGSLAVADVNNDGFADLVANSAGTPAAGATLYALIGADVAGPSQVTGVKVADNSNPVIGNELDITWNLAQDNVGVAGYDIRRGTSAGGPFSLQGTCAGASCTSIQDSSVSPETQYYYVVVASDAASNLGPASDPAPGLAADVTAPGKVTGLMVTDPSLGGRLNLAWDAATDNIGVDHYNVRRGTASGGPYAQLAQTSATSFADTGLTPGVTYYYVIEAVDARGNTGLASDEGSGTPTVTIDTDPPSQVTGLVVGGATETSLTLNWNPATDNPGGLGVESYLILHSLTGGGPYSQIATVNHPTTSFVHGGLTPNVFHFYQVQAKDFANNLGPVSAEASGRTPDLTPPGQVTGLMVTGVTTTSASLAWNAATDNVGVTGYKVKRALVSGGPYAEVGTTATTSFTDSGLADDTDHFYVVSARDAEPNEGPNSAEVVAHTLEIVTAPTPVLTADTTSVNLPQGSTVNFDGLGSTAFPGRTITAYNFLFGDGTSTGFQGSASASHTYSQFGTFTAQLHVRDSAGEQSTVPDELVITVNNVRDFTQDLWYPTIQSALNGAVSGSVIMVFDGTYDEDVVFPAGLSNVHLCHALNLMASPGPCSTVPGPTIEGTVTMRGDGARLEGFMIAPRVSPPVTAVMMQGGTGLAVANNELHLPQGGFDATDPDFFPLQSVGILTSPAVTDALIENNLITADDTATEGNGLGGTNGLIGTLSNSVIRGNVFRGWSANSVFLFAGGDFNRIEGNAFELGGGGILLCSSANNRILDNTFSALLVGVIVCENSSGHVLRDNLLGLTVQTALRIEDSSAGNVPMNLLIDARGNDFGVYDWRAIPPTRFVDEGDNNRIRYIPFKDPFGGYEPELVQATSPSHCDTTGQNDPEVVYDAAAPLGQRCRGFLSVQGAVDYAHPGETVRVPASARGGDPTPRTETVSIGANSLGEVLMGLTLCSAPAGASACDPRPAGTVIDATGLSPTALRVTAPGVVVDGFTFRVRDDNARTVDLRNSANVQFLGNTVEAGPTEDALTLSAHVAMPFLPAVLAQAMRSKFVREVLRGEAMEVVEGLFEHYEEYLGAVPVADAEEPHIAVLFRGPAPAGVSDRPAEDGLPALRIVPNYQTQRAIQYVPEDIWLATTKLETAPTAPLLPSPTMGIGPGSQILIELGGGVVGSCTANFIWKDSNNAYYLGSAGHCFQQAAGLVLNQPIPVHVCIDRCVASLSNLFLGLPGVFLRLGNVVYARHTGDAFTNNDFGIVRIPDAALPLVRPWMWFWAGPTGQVPSNQPVSGQVAVHYGHGVVAGEFFATEGRVGVYAPNAGNGGIRFLGSGTPGDSGSAMNRADPNRLVSNQLVGEAATGILTHLGACAGVAFVCTNFGTHIQRAIEMAQAEAGITLSLVLEADPIVFPTPGIPGLPVVTDTGTGNSLLVAWTPPASGAQVEFYKVYWGSPAGVPFAAKSVAVFTTGTSFTHTGRTAGQDYCYQITANTALGDEGQPTSPEVCATVGGTPDPPPPPPPFVKVVDLGLGDALSVMWGAPVHGRPITGYALERSTDGVNFSPLATTAARAYRDVGLAAAQTYTYRVAAFDDRPVQGAFSAPVSGVPTAGNVATDWPQAQRTVDGAAFTAAAGAIALPGERASAMLGGPVTASPLAADLDGDTIPEIVAVRDMGNAAGSVRVTAFRFDGGALEVLWQRDIPADPILGASPATDGIGRAAIGDVDDDGDLEVAVYTNHRANLQGVSVNDGKLTLLSGATGAVLGVNTADIIIGLDAYPRIADVGNNLAPGTGNEIVLVTRSGGQFFLDGYDLVGAAVPRVFRRLVGSLAAATPALVEADSGHDGLEVAIASEATLGSNPARLSIVNLCTPSGGTAGCSTKAIFENGIRNLAAGFLQPSTSPTVVAQARVDGQLQFVALDPTGISAGFSPGPLWGPPALADMDGDGLLDAVSALSNDESALDAASTDRRGSLFTHGFSGSAFAQKATLPRVPAAAELLHVPGGVVTADINGDGTLEAVFADKDGNLVAAAGLGGAGSAPLWSLPLGGEVRAPLALADVDGDGALEVIAATRAGRLVVVDSLLPTGPPVRMAVDIGSTTGATLADNDLHASGGGFDVEALDFVAQAFGVVAGGTASGAHLYGNTIRGDMLNLEEGTVGASNGVIGTFAGSEITGNTLTGWAANAMFLFTGGTGNTIEGNEFLVNGAGVLLCSSTGNEVRGNTFRFHFDAVALCDGAGPNTMADNEMSLTNGVALNFRDDTPGTPTGLLIEAPGNDWGAYTCQGILDRMEGEAGNAVHFAPWRSPLGLHQFLGVVNAGTGTVYCSLQDALAAASPGDTILVGPGLYEGEFVLDKEGVTLCSTTPGGTGCDPQPETTILRSDTGIAVRVLADDVTVQGFTIQVAGDTGNGESYAIEVPIMSTRDGLRVLDNIVRPDPASLGLGENGVRGRLSNAVVTGNRFEGWPAAVFLRPYGTDNLVEDNVFVANGEGVTTWSPRTTIRDNRFLSGITAVAVAEVQGDPTANVDTIVLRGNQLLTGLGVRIRSGGSPPQAPTNVVVDARLNDWGAYDWRLLSARVSTEGTGNRVLQIPFLLPNGQRDPPSPTVLPSNHCTASGFAPLDLADALGCGHAGGKVVLHPSLNLANPTPWPGPVAVDRNSEGELLRGLTICSAPLGSADCDAPNPYATVLDGSGGSEPALTIAAPDVTVKGLTIRHAASGGEPVAAVWLDKATGPRLEENSIVLLGGGCRAQELPLGACASPAPVTGVAGEATEAVLRRNTITADQLRGDGTLGGTAGVDAVLVGSRIEENTFGAWSRAVTVLGLDNVVERNAFRANDVGVRACTGADGLQVLKNDFLGHRAALSLCGSPGPQRLEAHDNRLGLTNGQGLEMGSGTAALKVNAECNDWGTYTPVTIRASRMRDDGHLNEVDVEPYTTPGGVPPPLGCPLPPAARFAAAPNPASVTGPVAFTDRSEGGTSPIVLREWTFGDGGRSREASPPHRFAAPGTYTVTLRVLDAAGLGDVTTQQVVVRNLPPVLDPVGPRSVDHGRTLTFTVTARDPEGTRLAYAASNLPPGASFDPAARRFAWTPTAAQAGTYPNVAFTASDGADSSTEYIVITVVDRPPALDPVGNRAGMEGEPLAFAVHAVDPEGDPVALSAAPLPAGASFVDRGDGTGSFEWLPAVGQRGAYEVVVRALSNLQATVERIELSIGHVNEPPVLHAPAPPTVVAGETLTLRFTTTDPDGPGVPRLTATVTPDVWGDAWTDHGDGTATWIWRTQGTETASPVLRVTASDGLDTNAAALAVTVHRPPEAYVMPPRAEGQDRLQPLAGEAVTLRAHASDPGGVVVSALLYPEGEAGPAVPAQNAGSAYEAPYRFTGTGPTTVVFEATDDTGLVRRVARSFEVSANAPPLAVAGEDVQVEGLRPIALDGAASFDPDGRELRSWRWTLPSGEVVESAQAWWTPTALGTFEALLEVTDSVNASAADRVSITVDDALRMAARFVGTDPAAVGATKRPVVSVDLRDDLGTPVPNAALVLEVTYEATGQVVSRTEARTNGQGFAFVALPYDTGTTTGANLPGGHTLRVHATAPSRAGAPDMASESAAASLGYFVAG